MGSPYGQGDCPGRGLGSDAGPAGLLDASQIIRENPVKKSILMLAGVAAFAVGAYFTTHLFAQQPPAAPTTPQAGTKIACVNVGQVFNNYVRAKAFKEELEKTVAPFKDRGKKLLDDIKNMQDAAQKPGFDPKYRDSYELQIRKNKRELEDMQLEIQKLIGKRQEDNMMTLWKEINMGIKAVSESAGYQIVLAYGDPIEKEMQLVPNVSRKMQAMDSGAIIPIYVHGSADISDWVTRTLNRWVEDAQKTSGVQPTGGQTK